MPALVAFQQPGARDKRALRSGSLRVTESLIVSGETPRLEVAVNWFGQILLGKERILEATVAAAIPVLFLAEPQKARVLGPTHGAHGKENFEGCKIVGLLGYVKHGTVPELSLIHI